MRFLLAVLAAVLLLSVLPFTGTPFTPAASAQDGPLDTRIEVTNVTPSLVDGQDKVTVTGSLTNRSDQAIANVEARIERGAAIDSDPNAQDAIRGNSLRVTEPSFSMLTPTLAPGQRMPFTIEVPMAGSPDSLQITEPGNYPLVVNINGVPSYGARARVAEADFLLPVISVPEAPVTPPPKPMPTTMLVPLVDYPRMESVEGTTPILTDDQLGNSISPGGRLAELVRTVDERVRPDSPLAPSLCFAIDPDLVATVDSLRGGYRVRQPDGSTREGTAAGAAQPWLDKLREVTAGRCVISLPYADADVVALGRADLPDLIKGSLDGSNYLKRILRIEPREDVLWPIDGALDEPAASALANLKPNTVLMRPSAMAPQADALNPARLNTAGSPLAVPIDPLVADALDPSDDALPTSAMSPQDNGSLSVQNALGALSYRAAGSGPGTKSVITPPRRWNLRADDLRALFSGMEALRGAGFIEPGGLPSASNAGTPPPADLAYPVNVATKEIQRTVLDQLAKENYKVGDLYRSSDVDRARNIDPAEVTTPLRDALLRGASSAWRGNSPASWEWVRKGKNRVASVLSAVQVDIPAMVTMGASNSPVPVKVTNQLPIKVYVELRTPRTSGIKINNLGELSVPPGGRSFWPETETQRAGRFTVDITATTIHGTKLGSPKRLQVESSNYDEFVLVLTGVAGALLIVLSGVRITRRVRDRVRRNANSPSATDGDRETN